MIVRTFELTRKFHLGSSTIVAVNKVNLVIKGSALTSIVGPSGSGKTTLLHLIGLNDNPTAGKVFFADKDTFLMSDKEKRRTRLFNIGFIFQTFNLLPTLTALENVELPMALAKISHKMQRKMAVRLLDEVELTTRLNHRPKELSAGERQRVAIARALANDPSLILADEPTGELDSETGIKIIQLLLDLCRKRKTAVVVATHDEKIIKVADAVHKIRDGSIVD
ncbi:ABC transporter ATP-binding protein [Candidatus Bathyarchaeota archaeon]|nr:ABC transporter ATP-binding protein [Candidatus Bathyarchaeota archaeon]